MSYELNDFFRVDDVSQRHSRVFVYPNREVAAKLLNHVKEGGAKVISVAECIPGSASRLPMPNVLMSDIDRVACAQNSHFVVVGLDSYLALLEEKDIKVFLTELLRRLDEDTFCVDYLLSCNHRFPFAPRYEEARRIVFFRGAEETPDTFHVEVYHNQWARPGANIGFDALLRKIDPFHPSGTYQVFLADVFSAQPGLGKAVSFITDIHEIALQLYGQNPNVDDAVLEQLLLDSKQCGTTPEEFLSKRFGEENCNPRLALNRLLVLQQDDLWPAYVWHVKKSLPKESYMAKVLSEDGDAVELLRNYVVGTAISVLSDSGAQKYATERAAGLKNVANHTQIEPLIVEFIAFVRDRREALSFLNCGTFPEKVEIVRRAAEEDFLDALPKEYDELYPALTDYLSPYNWGNPAITAYFQNYRRLKLSDTLTDAFAKWAYEAVVPDEIPTRDSVLEELRLQTDAALLVVDGLGIEYLPALTAMAKRCGLNVEPPKIVAANIPSETEFNTILWDSERTLAPVKGVDNIVHEGAEKHETASSERCFASTLQKLETDVLDRIIDGLSRFSRVVVTADHGASRLAVIARREGKSKDVPWNRAQGSEPLDWRYSGAVEEVQRPEECESKYFPESGKTYWVVRGYHRFPKKGGKKYALHGGASLEERLVPVLVFTRTANAGTSVAERPVKKQTAELKDEFEGII